ncbi:hypothetical protein COCMIDRAFT_34972 [Bipolaris oryzae ATCC 44560]|uniref:homogentisate 1,2-dioxygenase n=1 Tax=Bipolaris oryzae ATCC 44560 TaxID=930090 RepID=W6ZCA7_COCMI|nr:uncharacterized protein COCMIDRAFT_34972 [Bipolaris oryzae ATCC 44560]EUC47438.1 hypothetical protein COCMIDRAFT_34972 [Bipolaris oryzae ATCC 44560]
MSNQKLETMEDYKNIFHWAETQKDGTIPSFDTRKNDPYEYQAGIGNHFVSEAVPGTIPRGQNQPRVVRFGLYAELISGSAFVAPRHLNKRSWFYRARPSLAHKGFDQLPDNKDIESCFLPLNPKIHVSSAQIAWRPFELPTTGEVDLIDGLKTICGSGDPSLREGLAVHIYACNKSMDRRAFVNSDGDWLIVPQEGNLDIQTEFGMLYVQPGEICVLQKGCRFRIGVEGSSRGYITEIWGSAFQLPDGGLVGSNGMANIRDFLSPVAKYDIDDNPWEIINRVNGRLFKANQDFSPFNVVAWQGNYVPFKYDLTKFVVVGSVTVDHLDPSIFTVLTAPSRDPLTPLVDFLALGPRWDVTSHTYRPPSFHRNAASELIGLIYGGYDGRSDAFNPGGISLDSGFVPHGISQEEYVGAVEHEAPVHQISKGAMAFMVESARQLTITDWAWNHENKHLHNSAMFEALEDNFSKHKDEIDQILQANQK